MKRSIDRRSAREGFTLMELLLVMAILVILLGLVAPRFLGTQKKANINAAKAQIGLFKSPLEMYALDMNGYPTTEQGLAALVEAPSDLEDPTKWKSSYLSSSIPQDPWGHDYQYASPATRNTNGFPDIWSLGPDGEEGTEDDIGNWEDDEGDAVASTGSSS